MENYLAEPLIEHEVEPSPFNMKEYFHIEVPKDKGPRRMADKVLKHLVPDKPIVLFAAGRATANAVSCAEVLKTCVKRKVYQITRIGQVKTIETWSPAMEGLDPLRVTRSVPIIYILLSLENLDDNELGFQMSVGRRKQRQLFVSMLSESLDEDHQVVVAAKNLKI